jgi:TPR repeat protein
MWIKRSRDAELGFAPAYQSLGIVYGKGDGVSKGKKKARRYHELAAIAGCVKSRLNLALYERKAGRFDRAIKHWLIAASQGDVITVNFIRSSLSSGYATTDHYNQALQGYQLYLDEVKSDQRDKAAAHSHIKYKNCLRYRFNDLI